jgi:hypothetical protein
MKIMHLSTGQYQLQLVSKKVGGTVCLCMYVYSVLWLVLRPFLFSSLIGKQDIILLAILPTGLTYTEQRYNFCYLRKKPVLHFLIYAGPDNLLELII